MTLCLPNTRTLVSRPATESVSNTWADMMMGSFRAKAKPISSSVWHLMKFASREKQESVRQTVTPLSNAVAIATAATGIELLLQQGAPVPTYLLSSALP